MKNIELPVIDLPEGKSQVFVDQKFEELILINKTGVYCLYRTPNGGLQLIKAMSK
jgi:hypothetical protein